jgi:predicted transcriptional regulator
LELEILKTVWRDGPSSGRQICDALADSRPLAHTSVLTVMNIMVKKGYLRRTKPGGTYLYEATISEQATVRRMLGDLVDRAFDGSAAAIMCWIEFGLLTIVPFFMFMSPDVRRSPGGLFAAALMYIIGVMLNRCTVFFIAYQPPYAEKAYVPAIGEFALTIGLIAAIMFVYRAVVTLFPVLTAPESEAGSP